MDIDFDDLLDNLGSTDGPRLKDRLREEQQQELLQKVLERLAQPQPAPQVRVTAETPPAQVVVTPSEPRKSVSWTFEFERNADGTIKRIHATPKE